MIWPKVSFGEIVTFRGGGTPRKDVPDYWSDEIPWATVKDFKGPFLDRTQNSISAKGLEKSAVNIIPAGHVIIPTRMALGKAAINKIDLAINQDLRALISKSPLDPV
jgi:type I restriction enzyme S subunit